MIPNHRRSSISVWYYVHWIISIIARKKCCLYGQSTQARKPPFQFPNFRNESNNISGITPCDNVKIDINKIVRERHRATASKRSFILTSSESSKERMRRVRLPFLGYVSQKLTRVVKNHGYKASIPYDNCTVQRETKRVNKISVYSAVQWTNWPQPQGLHRWAWFGCPPHISLILPVTSFRRVTHTWVILSFFFTTFLEGECLIFCTWVESRASMKSFQCQPERVSMNRVSSSRTNLAAKLYTEAPWSRREKMRF